MANSAHAVQIIGENSFQMCWDYPMSVLQQGSYYRVLNSEYAEVEQTSYNLTNSSFSNDIFGQHSNINRSYVFLQVVPSATMQGLPSRLIRVDISGQYNKFNTLILLHQSLIIMSSSWSDSPSHELFYKPWKCYIYREHRRR